MEYIALRRTLRNERSKTGIPISANVHISFLTIREKVSNSGRVEHSNPGNVGNVN